MRIQAQAIPARGEEESNSIDRLRSNLTRLAFGSIVAQAIVAVSTPVLTRLFAPEAFGVAALVTAAYGFLIPFMTLKYDQVVVMPKAQKRAMSIGAMVMIIATANSAIVGAGVLAYFLIFPEQRQLSWLLLPVALWLGSAYTLMQQWSSRVSNYTHYARGQVIGAVVNVSICVGAALIFFAEPVFIVLGFTAGMGVSLGYTVWGFKGWPFVVSQFRLRAVVRQIKFYREFPALVLPTALSAVVGANAVPLVLASRYSLGEVGLFAVTNRVLLIPSAIVGGALAEAIRSEFAARHRAGRPVKPVFRKTLTAIIVVAGGLFGGIYVVAPDALSLLLGLDYAASGTMAQALILAAFAQFIGVPFVYVLAILGQPAMGLVGQVVVSLLPVGALILLSRLAVPLNNVLFVYSLCTLVAVALALTLVYRGCNTVDLRARDSN